MKNFKSRIKTAKLKNNADRRDKHSIDGISLEKK